MKRLTLGYAPEGSPQDGIGPFKELFTMSRNLRFLEDIQLVDAIVLWGGADISPSIYNSPGVTNGGPFRPSMRDIEELAYIEAAVKADIPIIGVCRGAQLACAYAGGKLVQHVNGHGMGFHDIITYDGEMMRTNSCHHQMMYPYEVPHDLLAWSKTHQSGCYMGIDDHIKKKFEAKELLEPEVVYFPDIKALCVQGHPEWLSPDEPLNKWFMDEIKHYFFKELECC